MTPTGKIVAFVVLAAVLAISAWGWLQVPKLMKSGLFAEFDPQYRECTEKPISQTTEAACNAVLANRTLDPATRAKVLIHRGVWYNRTGRYRDAIRDFDGVMALSPDPRGDLALAALTDRVYAESMLGENAKAWTDADRVVALAPDNIAGYEARSGLHERAGQFALAAQDFDAVVRLMPDKAYSYNGRCWQRAIANELPGALEDCNHSLALDPRYWPAMDSLAFVYFRMGQYAKARDEYDAAVLAGSNAAATFYMRGVTKLRLGAPTGGIADIEYAKTLDRDVPERFATYGVRA